MKSNDCYTVLSDESVEILQELVDKNVGENVEGVDYRFEFGDDPEYFVEFYIDQNEGNDEYFCTVCQDNHFRIFDAEMEELAENPLEFFEMLAEGIWCVEKTYVDNDRLFASYDFEKVMEYLEDEFDATMYDCDDVQIVRYSDDTYDYCIDTRNITDYVSFGGRSDDE